MLLVVVPPALCCGAGLGAAAGLAAGCWGAGDGANVGPPPGCCSAVGASAGDSAGDAGWSGDEAGDGEGARDDGLGEGEGDDGLMSASGSAGGEGDGSAVGLPSHTRHLLGTSSRQKWLWKHDRHVSAYCSSSFGLVPVGHALQPAVTLMAPGPCHWQASDAQPAEQQGTHFHARGYHLAQLAKNQDTTGK